MKSFDKSLSKEVETVRYLRWDGASDSGLNSWMRRKSQFSLKRNEHLKNAPISHAVSGNQQFGLAQLGSSSVGLGRAHMGVCSKLRVDRLFEMVTGVTGPFALSMRQGSPLLHLVVTARFPRAAREDKPMHKNLSSLCLCHICY